MVDVNEALTRQVATLARLELSDSEVKTFTSQVSQIIHYTEKLQEVNVQGVEPLSHPLELPTFLRPDVVAASPVDSEGKPKVLGSAPEVLYDGFKVPPIL
jgi:aspartyl-tRNA(Asn)/glutamyl-tRNA(Gln) amidotransferase subunit C